MTENLDSNWFEKFLRGDKEAFESIFRTYYRSLIMFANKIIENQEDSKDLVNETFVALFKKRHTIKDKEHVKSFLFVSIRNRCFNFLKKNKRRRVMRLEFADRIKDDALLKYEYMIRAEVVKAVHQAIDSLPDDCKRIFKMLFYDELKPTEVATLLNITVNNVYVQKSHAIRALRIKVGPLLLLVVLLLRIIRLLHVFLFDTVPFRK